MSDITTLSLEAAILDQKVAGTFAGKTYAFVGTYYDGADRLGVAVANEPGFIPVYGKTFENHRVAARWATELNRHIGLDDGRAAAIVISTMGGRRVAV